MRNRDAARIAAAVSLLIFALASCSTGNDDPGDTGYRQAMRRFVIDIAGWCRNRSPGFIVIPQNGQELFTLDGTPEGAAAGEYLAALDGTGREDLYYGWSRDGRATPATETERLEAFLDMGEDRGIEALITDYMDDFSPMSDAGRLKADDAIARAAAKGYLSFPAPSRGLEVIPLYPGEPVDANPADVAGLSEAKNFLYLLDPTESFADRDTYLAAIDATGYDLFIIDAYYDGNQELTSGELSRLKTKPGGGRRLVIAYLSIGEAEDYRAWWNPEWETDSPSWLAGENRNWPGNYKVRYWEAEWQDIIFGTDASALGYITDVGFDGVYLDIIDAFEYFE